MALSSAMNRLTRSAPGTAVKLTNEEEAFLKVGLNSFSEKLADLGDAALPALDVALMSGNSEVVTKAAGVLQLQFHAVVSPAALDMLAN